MGIIQHGNAKTTMASYMMTSSSGNICRVTGPLCGEFTGPGEFPAQRPVTRSFDVFFDLRPNKRLSKQSWGWWFETPSRSLWCHRNVTRSSVGNKSWPYDGVHIIVGSVGSCAIYCSLQTIIIVSIPWSPVAVLLKSRGSNVASAAEPLSTAALAFLSTCHCTTRAPAITSSWSGLAYHKTTPINTKIVILPVLDVDLNLLQYQHICENSSYVLLAVVASLQAYMTIDAWQGICTPPVSILTGFVSLH